MTRSRRRCTACGRFGHNLRDCPGTMQIQIAFAIFYRNVVVGLPFINYRPA